VTGIFVVAQGDLGVFMTTYFPSQGETVDLFTPERCREMVLKAIGAPVDVDVIDVAPWQPYEQVADQFRCGRVFLIGDAAHTHATIQGRRGQQRHRERAKPDMETGCRAERDSGS